MVLKLCLLSSIIIAPIYKIILNSILKKFNTSISFLKIYLFLLIPIFFLPINIIFFKFNFWPISSNFSFIYSKLGIDEFIVFVIISIYCLLISLFNFTLNKSLNIKDLLFSALTLYIFLIVGSILSSVISIIIIFTSGSFI